MIYQCLLGYGTAYRLTKEGSDNGVGLFLWIFAMTLVAIVPGLGFFIWNKYKNIDVPEDKFAADTTKTPLSTQPTKTKRASIFGGGSKKKKAQNVPKTITCEKCGREYDAFYKVCSGCGHRDLKTRND